MTPDSIIWLYGSFLVGAALVSAAGVVTAGLLVAKAITRATERELEYAIDPEAYQRKMLRSDVRAQAEALRGGR